MPPTDLSALVRLQYLFEGIPTVLTFVSAIGFGLVLWLGQRLLLPL